MKTGTINCDCIYCDGRHPHIARLIIEEDIAETAAQSEARQRIENAAPAR